MADTTTDKTAAAAPVASAEEAPAAAAAAAAEVKVVEETKLVVRDDSGKVEEKISKLEVKDDAEGPKEPETLEKPSDVASEEKMGEREGQNKSNADEAEAKDAAAEGDVEAEVDITVVVETPAAGTASSSKNKNRRKSTGDAKAKPLNKKGSKARLTHLHARPGGHFLVKLRGFPNWPAIICDEDMLPHALVSSRPVSAARPDGSYAEAYAEGGKRVHDRTFPVMYLYTNEFGWVANTALTELTADKAKDSITEKMRKDLKAAFELAAEQNSIEHYKDILVSFQEELIAQEEARKEAAATPKKSKKSKAAKAGNEYDDVEMADADEVPKPKAKKRKAEEDTPQRSESVKKPKIKLNTSSTPKGANGTPSAKAKDTAASKTAKAKTKKGKDASEKKSETPKEAKMTPEERHARKEKEVMYLRHKIQRGLLTHEHPPREDEMEAMSGFITILENFIDLEVSIIRATKINKVLKAILKLDTIPHEEEFGFKKRSSALLDKWNKLLAGDGSAAPAAAGKAPANGVNGAAVNKDKDEDKEEEQKEVPSGANGVEEGAKPEAEKASGDAATSTKSKTEEEEKSKDDEAEKEKGKADEEME